MRVRAPRGDRSAPQLQQTTPADNAPDVAVNANLILTFNEAVKAGSGFIQIRDAVTGNVVESIAVTDTSKVTFSGNQLTVNPGSDLSPGTSYYVTFASGVVLDLASNAFAGISSPTAFNFSTSAPSSGGSPVLMSVSPADNATGVLPWSNIVLAFSEEVKPGSGNIEIRKSSDNSLVTSISIEDTFQVSFADHLITIDPHITLDWNTGYYVTFASGVIQDLQNNAAAGITSSTAFNFTTTPNNTNPAPALVSQSPVDDATSVAVNANLVFTFNEPIKLSSSTGAMFFQYTDGSAAKYIFFEDASQVSISGNTLTINPNTDFLSNTEYTVTFGLGNITDLAGMGFGGTVFEFTTGVSTDVIAPLLSSTLPADNATDQSRTPSLFLYFNEGVKKGTGNIEIHRSSDGSLVQSFAVTDTNHVSFYENQIAISVTSLLDWNTGYYVSFAAGVIEDYAGNDFVGIASASTFNFTTMGDPAVSPPVLIATFPFEGYGPVRIDGNASLIFSEFVQAGTGTVEIHRASNNALVTSINIADVDQVSFYQDRATINWEINLDPYTEYYVLVSPGAIEDLAGNDYAGISSATRLAFTTGPLIPPESPPISGGVFAWAVSMFGPDTEAPWLTQILPVDDATNVPIEGNLIFRFSETVAAGSGNLEIRHSSDGSLFKSIALSDTSQVQFQTSPYFVTVNPNVNLELNTGYYIVLQPGAVQDLSGNPYAGFSSPLAYNFTTASAADTTAPTLTDVFPSDVVNVATNANIGLHFDEQIAIGTGNIEIRRLLDGSLLEAIPVTDANRVQASVESVFINPSIDFDDGAAYYITFGSGVIKDLAGNAFGGLTAAYFTTADQNDPLLLSASPTDDATNVAVNANIILTFDEPVQAGGAFIFVSGGSQGLTIDVNDTSQVTFYENTVTINPSADLTPGATYSVSVSHASVKDLAGNAYFGIDTGSYTFTTASTPSGLTLTGNGLSNTLIGAAGNDTITGLGGKDTLTGAAGSDTFVYGAVSDSTSRNYDTITDFNGLGDVVDLWFQVTGVDASITGGSVGSRRFDSDLAAAVNSTKLAAHHAVLFAPSAGAPAGSKFLIVDANGVAGYQAGADIVILLGAGSTNLGSLTASDFV